MVKHFLLFPAFLFLFGYSDKGEPCVKERRYDKRQKEIKEFPNCDDTLTYYLKRYVNDVLVEEGNVINSMVEGVWKYYYRPDQSVVTETIFFHNKKIKIYYGDKIERTFINDSVIYETRKIKNGYAKGALSKGDRIGIWEEVWKDSTGLVKSYGSYLTLVDTFTVTNPDPPYEIRDTVSYENVKVGIWFYFTEDNRLIKTEEYVKGKYYTPR